MKKKNSVVSADGEYARVIGTAVLDAMQSKGVIRPGGKVIVTITMHLPEESSS